MEGTRLIPARLSGSSANSDLLGRNQGYSAKTSFRPSRIRKQNCFSLAPGARVSILAIWLTLDITGIITAVGSLPREPMLVEGIISSSVVLFVFTTHAWGLYDLASSNDLHRSTQTIAFLGVIWVIGALGLTYALDGYRTTSQIVIPLLLGFSIIIIGRIFLVIGSVRCVERLTERVLVVSREGTVDPILRSKYFHGINVKAEAVKIPSEFGQPSDVEHLLIPKLKTGLDCAMETAQGVGQFNRIIIVKSGLSDEAVGNIIQMLASSSCATYLLLDIPKFGALLDGSATLCLLRSEAIGICYAILKRTIDIAFSLVLLLFIMPLLLCIGFFIYIESGGPILFKQTRLGRNNRPFTILKFRTMRREAPALDGSRQAIRNDARVTYVGALLRKTSLDELPQLLNVLNGTMSLVGPRPHPVELHYRFLPLVENYSVRHRLRPGMTGWAQVNGARGETRTVDQMNDRVRLDLEYVSRCSLLFDIWILIRTVGAVIGAVNAY